MTSNVGTIDRLLRLVIGVAFIAAPLLNFMGWGANATTTYAMIAVGAILVATSVFGICPLYKMIGFETKT